MIDFAADLVKRAGVELLSRYGKDTELVELRTTVKQAVTKYDRMIDELIVRELRARYPEHSLLTEESGAIKGDPDWLWIVDSLDGTANFANLNPLFAICLALMHKGELALGAVYAPAINELYLAEKGSGAFLNGARIKVSRITELEQSYLLSCEGGEKGRFRTGSLFARVYIEVLDIRKLGSAGLETAWVAAGKKEAYFITQIEPWDVAAGALLVQEAGGKVTDFQGQPWQPERADLIFSNGMVHQALRRLLREC